MLAVGTTASVSRSNEKQTQLPLKCKINFKIVRQRGTPSNRLAHRLAQKHLSPSKDYSAA
jgi:hypothetical protein